MASGDLKESGGRFALLYHLSQTFNSSLDLDEVLDRVMDEVIEAIGAERGFVALRDEDGVLVFRSARGIEQTTIDHPEFQTDVARSKFVERLTATINFANHIVVPSDDVKEKLEQRMVGTGHRVPVLVAPLGVDLGDPPEAVEKSDKPYFVVLGTIEPRKNHGFLLDIWERMHQKMDASKVPELRIIGARGWKNEALFDRLDNSPLMGKTVFELGPLPDKEMKQHLAGATGLLFPSLAEGFGLPPYEAASLGVPTITTPLPSIEAHLADMAVYAKAGDMYQWFRAIRDLASEDPAEQTRRRSELRAYRIPTWYRHFARVFDLIM